MIKPLRFGVICSGRKIALWQARAIEHLRRSGVADIIAFAIDETETRKLGFLWRLLERWPGHRSMQQVALAQIAGGDRVLRDARQMRVADLDVVLDLRHCGTPRPGNDSLFSGHDVWSFRSTSPACFWEIRRGEPTVYASLEKAACTKQCAALREGRLRLVNYRYSRSVDALHFEMAKWPAYAARQVALGPRVPSHTARLQRLQTDNRAPSLFDGVGFLVALAANALRRLYERGLKEEWHVGVVRMQPEDILRGRKIEGVRWLSTRPGEWAADPMAIRANGSVHVLCEQMRPRSGKGRISAASFDGCKWSALQPVIEPETHASYPYLLEYGGDVYCVPETFEAKEIALFRATEFPSKWERVCTLISGIAAIDSTIFEHDGLFWLFCTTSENSGGILHAYFANDLFGPWKPHLANPIKVDASGSRPAGAPFRIDGQLYRPTQDCSKTYGGRVVLQRVLMLSPREFGEEPCAWVEPPNGTPFDRGLHTLSFAGEYCVIDAKRFVRRSPGKREGSG